MVARFFILFVILFSVPGIAKQKIRLGLNWKPEPQFGGFYEAQRQQLFAKNNIDLEIIPGGSGTPTIQMLLANKIEYAIVSADEVILSHDRQNQEKVIALFAVYQKNPQILMVPKKAQIKNIAQLLSSNYQIAAQAGLPYFQFLQKKYPNMKAKVVPYNGGIAQYLSLENYAQQGFATSEPLLADKAKKPAQVFFIADEGYNPYTTVLAVNKKYFDQHKNEVDQMIQILTQSWTSYLKNPTETNQLMAQLNPSMNLEAMNESALTQVALIQNSAGIGQMTQQRWEELVGQMKDLNIIKSKMKATDLFYLSK